MMNEINGLIGIIPDWPAPLNVKAFSTTRLGGVSRHPYESLNLASHVADNPVEIEVNRNILIDKLSLPSSPFWLEQVHGVDAVRIQATSTANTADASFTNEPNRVCAVLTADCLPVLITDVSGTIVCAVHAGWKGLCAGVLENTIAQLPTSNALMAWIGPCIGKDVFEVDDVVREQFVAQHQAASSAFVANREGHWLADLVTLAKLRLQAVGVQQIYGGHYCTYQDAKHFFSYRRDGITGRMATMIWMTDE